MISRSAKESKIQLQPENASESILDEEGKESGLIKRVNSSFGYIIVCSKNSIQPLTCINRD